MDSFSLALESLQLNVSVEIDSNKAMVRLEKEVYDLIYVDLKMQPIDGFNILQFIKKKHPLTTVVIISGFQDFEDAKKSLEYGAYHIIKKPVELSDFQFFTQKALEFHKINKELKELKNHSQFYYTPKIITQNPEYLKIIKLARDISESDLPILLTGESGTGKELLADFIFENSSRAKYPFIKVNCSSIPEYLLDTEFFGSVKDYQRVGAPEKIGKLEQADGGTIFLDEITELPAAFQVKLYNFLQNGILTRVGDSAPKKVNLRVISATNINIEESIKEKTFREDLYYLLNGAHLKMIPLRERPEDISILIKHFLKIYGVEYFDVSTEALNQMKVYRWRGNVRELQNVVHRAIILAKGKKIDIEHLPDEIKHIEINNSQEMITLEELEKIHIKKILQRTNDYKEAAQILGIDLTTLWRKRKKYYLV
ncbi:MAG: sigma-54-dependent Fis family transcriptional regulator [Leptospiraceae bacterium]|nr:sigma-54-dependent Fis family transcriptional regulator [Leptospiraceae bacterium]MCP5512835.1 sigma-54-dependent Fis family transcriptional regulator [Leptospiraceae bacterium]